MIEIVRQLLDHQFAAALCTLNLCVERCPASIWDAKVANLRFCQVAFHTLFFADYYLEREESAFRLQPFHRQNAHIFRDYEELEDRAPVLLYDKPAIVAYVQHCRTKATETIAAETEATLAAPCNFPRKTFSRAELYVYNLRHLQHHAAQLGLRLRLDAHQDLPWIGSGWREV